MEPQLWYHTLPVQTKAYFTISILVTLLLQVYSQALQYVYLDRDLVLSGFEVWRLSTNFFVWGGLLMSAFQIGLLGHYFRSYELQYARSHREAFHFFLLLLLGSFLTVATSLSIWPDLRFGGPVLLLFVITIYAWRDPNAPAGLFGFTVARKYLPFGHWAVLYICGTNWTLAALGILYGVLSMYGLSFLHSQTGLIVHPSLDSLGEKLKLGEATKVWQVNRAPGVRLGGAETMRWSAGSGQATATASM
jgi:hypothetical protein